MKEILKYFRLKTEKKDAFADFFGKTSSRDQKKVFKEVVKKVNTDQRLIVEKYNKKALVRN